MNWVVAATLGIGIAALTGCSLLGMGAVATAKSIDPKAPKAQTAESCKEWECFDGYACGPCPESEQ